MDFVNQTGVCADWTVGFDRDGRELVVVAVKATFVIPPPLQEPTLANEQVPLIAADTFTGDPGVSAPLQEVDYAHRKPACDVLLNGKAWAPAGRAVTGIAVGLKVGPMAKAFMVVGDRVWRRGVLGVSAGAAQPFVSMPISYDNAFGGVDAGQRKTYLANPVGRGFAPSGQNLPGQLLPNTEEIGRSIDDASGSYRPMSFGPIGRNWLPRSSFAGTYDDAWIAQRAPFWPADFDDRYFQAAPADQQIPFPAGGEEVVLKNLTPEGHVGFRLPSFAPPVLFVRRKSPPYELRAVTDTILIEPDCGTFSLTARVSLPMKRSCFDLTHVVAGRTTQEWLGRQRFGRKPYYRSLAELVQARKR